MISLIQHFEADFLWKVSLKILNSGIILKTFTQASHDMEHMIKMSLDRLKANQRSFYDLPNSAFLGWLSVESQPQNPDFRNNPENSHDMEHMISIFMMN